MIEIVWAYVVKEGAQGHFELAYGPGGAWSQLLAQAPGFRGLSLLRDLENPSRYLTVEVWDQVGQREQMTAGRQAAYAELEADLAEWTAATKRVGSFRMLSEGSVRPRGRARRGGAGPTGRRRGRAPG